MWEQSLTEAHLPLFSEVTVTKLLSGIKSMLYNPPAENLLLHTHSTFLVFLGWGCLATETPCCTQLCHHAVDTCTQTHTHSLIWTSTPTNNLNIDRHWRSQHTRAVSGEAEGYSSVFYVRTPRRSSISSMYVHPATALITAAAENCKKPSSSETKHHWSHHQGWRTPRLPIRWGYLGNESRGYAW